MSTEKIEIKITTDSEGTPIHLNKFSPKVAESLSKILLNMAGMIKNCYDNQINIQIREGCVAVDLSGNPDVMTQVENDFVSAANNDPEKEDVLKYWKSVQSLVRLNGLHYELNTYDGNNVKTEYLETLEKRTSFKIIGEQLRDEVNIHFLPGYLYDIGGKRTINFHILSPVPEGGNKEYIIKCSKEEGLQVGKLLFQNVLVSFYDDSLTSDDDTKGRYCDIFKEEDGMEFNYLEEIYLQNKVLAIDDSYGYMHDKVVSLINDNSWDLLGKLIKMYSHDNLNPNYLHSILVTSKHLRDSQEFGQHWKAGYDFLKKKNLI